CFASFFLRTAEADERKLWGGDRMRRRTFISLLGGAAAWPLAARAQQPSTQVARIGVLNTGLDDAVSGGLGYRVFVADMQKRGYVTSLVRPGGRITGLFNRQPELAQKRVELLTEAFPTRTRLAVLWDASSSEAFAAAEGTAKALSLQFYSTKLQRPPYDFDAT